MAKPSSKKSEAKDFNITDYFFAAAKKYPSKDAIITLDDRINFAELAQEVRLTAQYFIDQDIKAGERVLVFVPMSIDLYRIVLALFYIGATAVFLDEWASRDRLKICCRLAECRGFIGTPKAKLLRLITKEIREIPICLSLKGRGNKKHTGRRVAPDASALITFTTGSTGIPKAADRTHGFLEAQFEILKGKLDSQPTDVDMPILPIVLFMNLGVGATSVIADFNARKPQSIKPKAIIKQLSHHKVNRLIASPFVVKKLAEHSIRHKIALKELQQIFTGGAPVFPSEAGIYARAFPHTDIQIIYGSTEAEPISSIDAIQLSQQKISHGLAVGKIHLKTTLKVISIDSTHQHLSNEQDFSSKEVPEGATGEIVVYGDHVLKKYYKNPKAFQENKIYVGNTIWHKTGDSGFIKDGQLFLTGRCAQLIKRDGQYISPFIIENKIQALGSAQLGTILEHNNKIYLVVESGIDKTRLETSLDNLDYDQLIYVEKIPRDPRHHSKIDYNRLKQQIDF